MARDMEITGTRQLGALARRLEGAAGDWIRGRLRTRITTAAEVLADDLRSTVRGLQIRGQGSSGGTRRRPGDNARAHRTAGLRETVATSVKVSPRSTGARVWVDKNVMPSDQRNLPAHLDNGHWRHPVFGNPRRWVNQYAQPWWAVTIRRNTPRIRAEVARVLDDIERRLGA